MRNSQLAIAAGLALTAAVTLTGQSPQPPASPDPKAAAFATPSAGNATLTAVEGIKVGHITLAERPTGCTAVLFKDGTVGGVDVRGGAPGTRETDLLDPVNNVQIVNAISLSGGSAFGLDAASGVMKWLDEHNIGYPVAATAVTSTVTTRTDFSVTTGAILGKLSGVSCLRALSAG